MRTDDQEMTDNKALDQIEDLEGSPDAQTENVSTERKTVRQKLLHWKASFKLSGLLSWIITLGSAVVIALLIRFFLFEPIRVQGESMRDTLANGEIMFVTKIDYLFSAPKQGDVIICKYPGRTEYFVKRLMGCPGDIIEIQNNLVYRNGELLEEPYLTPANNNRGLSMEAFELKEGEYFVMGDNRDNSHDSRNYYYQGGRYIPAALTRDQIIGHVQCVLFPFGQIRGIE